MLRTPSFKRAWAASLVALACALVPATGAAQSTRDPQTILADADRLDKEAIALNAKGKSAEAAVAEERSISMQETEIVPRLAAASQPMFRQELTPQKLRLVIYLAKSGNERRARELLAAEIAFHEKLGSASKRQKDLPEWRSLLGTLGGASTAPSTPPSPPPARAPETKGPVDQIAQAMKLYREGRASEAVILLEAALPAVDTSKAISPNDLAIANFTAGKIYEESMRLTKAETRYLRALAVKEAQVGTTSPEIIDGLMALGSLYMSRGEHERAAPYFMRAHDIAKSSAKEKRVSTILALASVLRARRDFKEAALLIVTARSLIETKDVGDAVTYMLVGVQLGQVYEELGGFADAEREYDDARTHLEPLYKLAPDQLAPMWAGLMYVYGWHHRKRGNWAKAEAYLKESLELRKKAFKPGTLAYANGECDLGEVYWASGDLARSLDPIQRCFDVREETISRVLASGSEEQKRSYLASFLLPYQKTLTAQVRAGNTNPKLTRLALSQVLRTKGRVLDAMSGENQALRRGTSAESRDLLDRLATVRSTLAKLSGSGNAADKIKKLEEESRVLEQKLSEASEAYRIATKPVSVESVRAAIPAGGVLVEIVSFNPLDPLYKRLEDQQGDHYVAFVVHGAGGSEPKVVDLGPAAPIDEQVKAFRAAVADRKRDPASAARALHASVWKPLELLLEGKKNVLLSPDGALNTVPFAALQSGDDYLVSSYTLTYLTSGRDLLRLSASHTDDKSVVLVANPAFAMNGTTPESTSSRFAKVRFPSLPGTQEEADSIKRLIGSADLLSGNAATESAVKRLRHPRVLHLATHGFFMGDESVRLADTRGLVLEESEVKKNVVAAESPLVRSGLALAGASSQKGGDGEDGILTALEVSSLDLVGTELVVLSACQTAQGETRNGEGVYGLRRALTLAGARSLVMSLWSVDDDATSYLMRGYYKRLKDGEGRSDALRNTQMIMAKSKTLSHPFYWAAFIPSGDSAKMAFPVEAIRAAPVEPSSPSTPTVKPDKPNDDPWLDDVGRKYDIPYIGFTFGFSSLILNPTAAAPAGTERVAGRTLYAKLDFSLFGTTFGELGNKQRSGFALYDRGSIMLAGVTVDGGDIGAHQLDYTLLMGFRTRLLGLFAGAMAGTGALRVNDDLEATGPFVPLAGRVELPWFFHSRIIANAWGVQLTGERKTEGLDIRLPIGTPHFWLALDLQHHGGREGQGGDGSLAALSLAFGPID